jgi:hypothetical protein
LVQVALVQLVQVTALKVAIRYFHLSLQSAVVKQERVTLPILMVEMAVQAVAVTLLMELEGLEQPDKETTAVLLELQEAQAVVELEQLDKILMVLLVITAAMAEQD